MNYSITPLPLPFDTETKAVFKKTTSASRALAELKSIAKSIPNETILLHTLILQEAKDSSEVENIITTHDELFKADLFAEVFQTLAAKEVQSYAEALKKGFQLVVEHGFLSANHIIEIQTVLEGNHAGFRKQAGTTLKNAQTGAVVYTPPQDHDSIVRLMSNLMAYINDDMLSDEDPLVKMAIIHFQFESIHPFYDGNGRTGRIINILYLVLQKLLDAPILYLSRYIVRNKQDYYRLLQEVRDKENWEDWILFVLEGVEQIAKESIVLIKKIKDLMQVYKHQIRDKYKFYSQDLLNNLFKHPYTKIEFLERDLGVSRLTAGKYLNALCQGGWLEKYKIGQHNFYINRPLFDLFVQT